MITAELLDKFKSLYKEQFNITLSDEEATHMATDFLNLMKVLLRPEPKDEKVKKAIPAPKGQIYETK